MRGLGDVQPPAGSGTRRLNEELPLVDFTLSGEMLVPELVDAVRAGRVDLALLRPAEDMSGLEVQRVRHERLIVALPETSRLAARRRLRIIDLREETFIAHPGGGRSVMHGVVGRLCREAGFEPDVRHEVNETSTLVTFVADGLGVAVVPQSVADLGIPGATYRPLSGGGTFDLLAGRRAAGEEPLLRRMLNMLLEVARQRV